MTLTSAQRHPVMCITQDNLPLSHVAQTQRLCAAGARWIQLRMKTADPVKWLEVACEVVLICRDYGAVCIVNDSVEIARASGADGAHLGRRDGSWREARAELGWERILGGTVNNREDARAAAAAECLDYVGVGPWRYTANKQNLAPILGPDGVRGLVQQLDGLPAWAIGGIGLDDLAAVQATGAAGAAVSSALYRNGDVEGNYQSLVEAWAK